MIGRRASELWREARAETDHPGRVTYGDSTIHGMIGKIRSQLPRYSYALNRDAHQPQTHADRIIP